jgi:hypothetical protein
MAGPAGKPGAAPKTGRASMPRRGARSVTTESAASKARRYKAHPGAKKQEFIKVKG